LQIQYAALRCKSEIHTQSNVSVLNMSNAKNET